MTSDLVIDPPAEPGSGASFWGRYRTGPSCSHRGRFLIHRVGGPQLPKPVVSSESRLHLWLLFWREVVRRRAPIWVRFCVAAFVHIPPEASISGVQASFEVVRAPRPGPLEEE